VIDSGIPAGFMASADEGEQATVELSGEASSVVASWLGLDSGEDSDESGDDELDSEKFVRAPRLGLGAKFIPHKKPAVEV